MRRWAALLLPLLILLTGCRNHASVADPVSEGFTCTIQATYRDIAVSGTLTRAGVGTLELVFDKPDTLNGLIARWDGETVTLSMYGLSFSVDPATVPESALGEEIVATLDAALRGEGERVTQEGKLVITGSGVNGAYELTCDADTGVPLTLSVSSLPLEVTFSDFVKQ